MRLRRPVPEQPVPLAGRVDHGWATAIGRRSENQDRAASAPEWAIVSDGIGGHAGGALAAELTVATVAEHLRDLAVRSGGRPAVDAARAATDALLRANGAVRARRRAQPDVADMGATATVVVSAHVEGATSTWRLASIGDSPAWFVGASGTHQLTTDDNVAGELVRTGAITSGAAASHPGRHLLLRAVGIAEAVEVQVASVALVAAGDAIVVGSDGLSAVLGPDAIGATVRAAPTAALAARALVDAAIAAGTSDNVTVAVLRHAGPTTP